MRLINRHDIIVVATMVDIGVGRKADALTGLIESI